MADEEKMMMSMVGVVMMATIIQSLLPKPEEEEDMDATSVSIAIYDSEGNLMPSTSPVSLVEGGTYGMQVTATNTSTKAGVPCRAFFTGEVGVWLSSSETGFIQMMEAADIPADFGAGETKTFGPYSFTIPAGTGGIPDMLAVAGAGFFDPAGHSVGSASENITITETPIEYGVDVDIGVGATAATQLTTTGIDLAAIVNSMIVLMMIGMMGKIIK